MKNTVVLGRTGITVNKDGLGALPLQRADFDSAVNLIRSCVDSGMNYIDTARAYSDSEKKLGEALQGRRHKVVIATKTAAATARELTQQLETSLLNLQTDYVDIYQLHNPNEVPGIESEIFSALVAAKKQGKIRFAGFTNHSIKTAKEAVLSGLFDVLQFPLSYLSSEAELQLVSLCAEKNVGFVAMKGFAGGLITNPGLVRRFMNELPNVLPIWGLQHMWELSALNQARKSDGNSGLNETDKAEIEAEKKMLAGKFCRGCAYCMPCPQDIKIFNCARTALLCRRAPAKNWFSAEWEAEMEKIMSCTGCRKCAAKCPYGLDTPELLKQNLAEYRIMLDEHKKSVK